MSSFLFQLSIGCVLAALAMPSQSSYWHIAASVLALVSLPVAFLEPSRRR
jgi:hypothetical protein